MKKILLIALTTLAVQAQFLLDPYRFGGGPGAALTADVLVYYKMEETGVNATRIDSADGQDLPVGGGSVGWAAGIIGNCFNVSGVGWIGHADSATLSTGDINYTWAGWFLLGNNFNTDRYFISKWSSGGVAGEQEYLLYFHSIPQRFKFAVGTAGGYTEVTSSVVPVTETWYFIVAYHDTDNNIISIQIDNGTPDTIAFAGPAQDTASTFAMNALNNTGTGSNSDGSNHDEIGFWKRLLTTEEVTYLYNAGAARTCCPFP